MQKKSKKREIKKPFNTKPLIFALLVFIFGVSLFLRIVPTYGNVFTGDRVKFIFNDAYYHMRIVDNLVHNFPKLSYFDPYYVQTDGGVVGGAHFFDWLLSSVIWIMGLGNPTQHSIDVVSAYFPAVLGALVVIPIYFVGKTLFNKWVGLISAGMIAILPGEFFGRSTLGGTDHHVAEVLFSAMGIMFLMMAIKKNKLWSSVCALLSGLFFGVYLLTWIGGLLFLFIATLYFSIQIVINHLQKKSSIHLGLIGLIMASVVLAMNFFGVVAPETKLVLLLSGIIPIILSVVSWLMLRRGLRVWYYPLVLLSVGVISVGILYLAMPSTFGSMLGYFSVLKGAGSTATTTMELRPILYPQGAFTMELIWGNFTTGLFLVPIAFGILVWEVVKNKEQNLLLFLVWTVVMVVLTLMQRRYAYYLAVNVALLVGYISYITIKFFYPKRKVKTNTEYANVILVMVIVFVGIMSPNLYSSYSDAKNAPFAPSDDWMVSLEWMKENTPEPFQGKDLYDNYYGLIPYGLRPETYAYPRSDYGVTAWWDYGYWITRIAHRVPSANPAQNPVLIRRVANLFLSSNETVAESMMAELKSKYVIVDLAVVTGKYYAVSSWAEQPEEKYFGSYYIQEDNKLRLVNLLYPEYYQSLCVRLYNFEGKAVTEVKPTVITYEDRKTDSGMPYRLLVKAEEFNTYQGALYYMEGLKSDKVRIVGTNPSVSPIELEAMKDYKLIYSSPNKEVKVFEYGQ